MSLIKDFPKYYFLIATILLLAINVSAQAPFYWQLTEENGLPSTTIYQVHQDKKGFMWFGTENGICRYDGKEIETFYHPDLLDNEILTIQEDSWGRIWFKNLAGQIAFIENEKVQFWKEGIEISFFCIIENHLIAISRGRSSLKKYKIKRDGSLLLDFGTSQNKENNFLFRELSVLGQNAYSLHTEAIYRINVFENKIKEFKKDNPTKNTPIKLYLFDENKILVANLENSSIYQVKNDSLQILSKEQNYGFIVNGVFKLNNKVLIIGEKGIGILDDQYNLERLINISEYKFNSFNVDLEGNLWLGSMENGVIIIPSLELNYINKDNSNICSNTSYFIFPSQKNELVIGHDNGRISIIDEKNIREKKIYNKGRARTIVQDSSYRYWIAGDKLPLTVLSENFSKQETVDYYTSVKSLLMSDENRIWIGTSGHADVISVDSIIKFKNSYFYDLNIETSIENAKFKKEITPIKRVLYGRIYAVFQSDNKFWIGTSKGIYISESGQPAKPFLEKNEHVSYSITAITQSRDSIVWFATQAHGLLGIKNDSIVSRIDENLGLTTNNCSTLFCDEFNNLWIGSKEGLHKLNLNTFEIEVIDKYDGLPTNEISSVYVRDSIVWLGTQKGLVEIPFSAIKKNQTPPPIHITNITFWEKDTILLNSYDLDYNQNNINIEYVGITYRNRGKTTYQYRMLGVDTNWISTTARFARYPLLNAGEYEFEVKAINEDGVESVSPAKIQLLIHRPWWQTWWFYLFSFMSLVGLIGMFFYRRFQGIRKEEKQQQEFGEKINELRMMALQAQMNPHFVFNALSAIQKFLTTDEREQAMIYLARFAQLIRNIFEQSKEKLITLDEELEFLNLYLDLEKLRFKDKVKIDFQIDQSIKEDDYDIQIPPLLIQPILENAFKHGLMHKEEGGELKIEFSKNEEYLFCKIEDNGVGREAAAELGEGKLRREKPSGLKTAKERLAILNQSSLKSTELNNLVIEDLTNENQQPKGTKVEIKIKYNN